MGFKNNTYLLDSEKNDYKLLEKFAQPLEGLTKKSAALSYFQTSIHFCQ